MIGKRWIIFCHIIQVYKGSVSLCTCTRKNSFVWYLSLFTFTLKFYWLLCRISLIHHLIWHLKVKEDCMLPKEIVLHFRFMNFILLSLFSNGLRFHLSCDGWRWLENEIEPLCFEICHVESGFFFFSWKLLTLSKYFKWSVLFVSWSLVQKVSLCTKKFILNCKILDSETKYSK